MFWRILKTKEPDIIIDIDFFFILIQVSVSQAPSQRRSLIEVGRQQPIIPENSRLAVPMSGTDE